MTPSMTIDCFISIFLVIVRPLPSVGLQLAYFQLLFSAVLQEKAALRSWQPGNKTQNTAICHFNIAASSGSKSVSYIYTVSYTTQGPQCFDTLLLGDETGKND